VKDAALRIDVRGRHKAQNGKGACDVHQRDECAAPKHCPRNVRRGSRTSSLIADTNSSPVNANAICDQKFTVSQFTRASYCAP